MIVGAHRFQERGLIDRVFPNLQHILLVEPLPSLQPHLESIAREDRRIRVFACALDSQDGQAELHVTNNDAASSSLLRMADHRKLFPSVEVQGSIRVVTRTLDSLLAEHRLPSPDALLLDVQGAEHRIIGSLPGHRLEKLQVLLTEASTAEVYEGSAPLEVVERTLAGTHRIEAYAPLTASVPQHGNALFLRRDPSRGHPKVTAIVSVYRAERFLEGCLRDLTEQTLFKQGQLEILVVNTGSDQGEAGIAERWAGQHENIRYISTPERRTLYAAWNLGLAAARGRYITNANADDRHIPEALETLAAVLDQDSTIDLVYSDCAPTADPEVDVTRALASGRRYRYPDYFAPDVLLHYQFGIHPLWRRSVNARLGGFDESFQAAGDYEFNIRFALAGRKARHVDRVLGVYHSGPGTLTHGSSRIHEETAALLRNYRSASNILRLYSLEGAEVETPMGAACMLGDFGIRCLGQPQPWLEGGTTSNRALARIIWQAADAIQPGWRKHLDILPSAARIQQLDPEDATFVAENFESSSRELASV
jgi:FkbM family methyltransferase